MINYIFKKLWPNRPSGGWNDGDCCKDTVELNWPLLGVLFIHEGAILVKKNDASCN